MNGLAWYRMATTLSKPPSQPRGPRSEHFTIPPYHLSTTPTHPPNMSAAPLIVPALKRHTATVIVIHGLGDSGAGWYVYAVVNHMGYRRSSHYSYRIFLAENWRRRSKFEEISFIFPNAPSIPITMVCPTYPGQRRKQKLTRKLEQGISDARLVRYQVVG